MRTKVRKIEERVEATNGKSSVQWIRADHIRVDPETQRQLRPEWVKYLAENWNPDALGIIHVSRRKDAFYVMDGQHRVFACRLRGEPTRLLECKVYEDLSKPDEAQLFGGLNKQKNVRLIDDFRVSLNHDPDSIAINRIIESVGLSLSDQSRDGTITAIKACIDVYNGKPFRAKEPTPWALAKALRTLTDAWGTNRDAVSGHMVMAAGALHLRYGDELDAAHLARKLALFNGGPVAVTSRAKIRREMAPSTLWRSVAEVMVDIYNKGRRKTVLPPFTR
jgi:hypothetical protein